MSTAVVSYVVNGGPRPVSAASAERVRRAIEELQYRPHRVASALARGSTRTYGFLVPDISNPFFATLGHAVEDRFSAAGMVTLLGDSAESAEREEQLLHAFAENRVEGILYVSTDGHNRSAVLRASGVPVVVLDRAQDSEGSSVSIDNESAAFDITTHLVNHGIDNVGIVRGPAGLSTADSRYEGWRRALEAGGIAPRPEWQIVAPYSRAGGYAASQELLAGSARPRGLLASNEQQAIGVLRYANEHGINIPEDLAVVTIDGTSDSEYSNPSLSTVIQPVREIARQAVDILIKNKSAASIEVTCIYDIAFRESCGCGPDTTKP